MTKKRIAIFLGAGAALPWGGPTCSDLDKIIINDTYFKSNTDDHIPLGKYLHDHLIYYFKDKHEINFETIISLIESLISYYTAKNASNTNLDYHEVWPSFLDIDSKFEEAILNYELAYSNNNDDPEEIQYWRIPKDSTSSAIPYAKNQIKAKVLMEVLSHFTKLVSNKIHEYGSVENISYYENINTSLLHFTNLLLSKELTPRFYTTNYDRLISEILKDNLKVFEGFTKNSDSENRIDTNKIYEDKNSIVHYNIHGCVYWELRYDDVINEYILLEDNTPYNPYGNIQLIETGKQTVLTNIILGYNKSLKMFLPPFKYFEHAFLDDCLKSNILCIIGTSLRDFNIQKTLSTALTTGNKTIIFIGFSNNNDVNIIRESIHNIDSTSDYSIYDDDKEGNWFINEKRNCYVYLKGFKSFLLERAWEELDVFN
jgi:hypothetical protein